MSSLNGSATILIADHNYFDYLEPENNEFDIHHIAWSLSRLCRFAGHIRREFDNDIYSVAQHCDLVSRLVPPEHALAGLLHDAPEAFMLDIVRPLKQILPDYKIIEARVERAVLKRFGLPYPMHPEVHHADRLALFVEQHYLMPSHTDTWADMEGLHIKTFVDRIVPMDVKTAREAFLARYAELMS